MPSKESVVRRQNDQNTVLAAMPPNQPVTASSLVKKTGLSSLSVGAFLRNAHREGKVEQVGTCCEKQGARWQMVALWRRQESIRVKPPITGLNAEDWQWMAYWAQRRMNRLNRLKQRTVQRS